MRSTIPSKGPRTSRQFKGAGLFLGVPLKAVALRDPRQQEPTTALILLEAVRADPLLGERLLERVALELKRDGAAARAAVNWKSQWWRPVPPGMKNASTSGQ